MTSRAAALRFPNELWLNVIDCSVAEDDTCWHESNSGQLESFLQVFPDFRQYLESKYAILDLSPYQEEEAIRVNVCTRHLRVLNGLPDNNRLIQIISRHSKLQLRTLSLQMVADRSLTASLNTLNSLQFAVNLGRLDLGLETLVKVLSLIPMPPLCLPNLLELQIGTQSEDRSFDADSKVIHSIYVHHKARELGIQLADFLQACINLRSLSLHLAMDLGLSHEIQWSCHQTDEGHDRVSGDDDATCVSMYNCALCRSTYDHNWGAKQENEATYILAQRLPNLSRVSWVDLWDNKQPSHKWGLRATYIDRSKDAVELLREDGRVKDWKL